MSIALVRWFGERLRSDAQTDNVIATDPPSEEAHVSRLGRGAEKGAKLDHNVGSSEISGNDAKVLRKVKHRAYQLDYALFNLCGIHFGWGSVIGLVPLIGDAGDAFLAVMIVGCCGTIDGGLPLALRLKMMGNVVLDFVIGLLPFIGDLADAMYKANTRNAQILEAYLGEKCTVDTSQQADRLKQTVAVDPSPLGISFEHDNKVPGPKSPGVIRNTGHETPTRTERHYDGWPISADDSQQDLERGN